MTLDCIISGGYVITMEGPGTGIINCGAVGILGNRIVAVGEADAIKRQYSAHRYIDASGKAIMPGFVGKMEWSKDLPLAKWTAEGYY